MTVRVTTERVTPEMALAWLAKMPKNRNVRPGVVSLYSRDMARGDWALTSESIKFDTEGNLLDGQHRLQAIIRADVPILMSVARGLDPNIQDVVDTGIKRTVADALALNGYRNSTNLSAAARLLMLIEYYKARGSNPMKGGVDLAGNKSLTAQFSNTEVAEFVLANPGLEDAVDWAAVNFRKLPNLQPSVIAAAYYTTAKVDSDETKIFWESMVNNATEGASDPRSVLLQRLLVAQRGRERMSQGIKLSMIYRTWNAWRSGATISRLPAVKKNVAIRMPVPI